MADALVNPQVLSWALQRAGMDSAAVAGKIKVKDEQVLSWLEGQARPTFRQAQNFAKAVHVPFGYLYLRTAPEEQDIIHDLRTPHSKENHSLSLNFRDLLRDVEFKRDWFVEFLEAQGAEPLKFVGKYGLDDDPMIFAADMREALLAGESPAECQ